MSGFLSNAIFTIVFIEIILGFAWGWMTVKEAHVSVRNPIEDLKDLYSGTIYFWQEPFAWGSLLLKAIIIVHGAYFFVWAIVLYIIWLILNVVCSCLFFILKHVCLFLFKSHKKS